MSRIFTAVLSAAIFSALLFVASPAQASGDPSWRNGQTVCVDLPGGQANINWRLYRQVIRWNNLPNGPRMVIRGTCPWSNSIKVRIESRYSNAQGVAYQHYNWETGRLQHVDIKLNPYAVKLFPRWQRPCLRQWAASHEFGHGIGLHHWPTTHYGNVMAYNGWLSNCGRPQYSDRSQYQSAYGKAA